MNKSLRLSEKWFRLGLWLVAFIFAGFLIGLGGTLIEQLPKVEEPLTQDAFLDPAAAKKAKAAIDHEARNGRDANEALEQARLKLIVAQADVASVHVSLDNWLATRRATARPDQDGELLTRTRALDELTAAERQAQAAVEAQEQRALDASQAGSRAGKALRQLQAEAAVNMEVATKRRQLRIFGYRLALTLPLLAVAGFLFKTSRRSPWWPFVWGFILFALFAFFVELVPYLPSYGGYVRYVVGIIVTVVVGRQAIVSLNRYLERQRLAELKPDVQRRQELSYDSARARLGKGVCPGCERPVDLKDAANDFCPHCGICLHDRCVRCTTRKSAFSKFCFSCGAAGAGRGVEKVL